MTVHNQKDISSFSNSQLEENIIQTDGNSKDGQNKCPKCGSTEITLNVFNSKLRCDFCRHEFEGEKISGLERNVTNLKGQTIGSGAQNIVADANDVVTFKCNSCGSEVVVDTSLASQARCHWCRNMLSVNQQIPNGSIPDMVLPFQISKEEAQNQIACFVGKRKFFAHPKFKAEFQSENIMGVYFPYMVVDINSHIELVGQGEHLVKRYTKGSGSQTKTYYDADLYQVEREFDCAIYGLTLEANLERLQHQSNRTNQVINAIMPFDIENGVQYNANYLKGYSSERRNINIEELKPLVEEQAQDVAKFKANDTLKEYDRGVSWKQKHFEVKGEQWISAYLPVWLYSYQQESQGQKIMHYVAVNGRTKETMGSVPIYMPKLIGMSFLVEGIGVMAALFIDFDYSFLFLLSGIMYFFMIFFKYRNSNARHTYETETRSEMTNLRQNDQYVRRLTGLSNSKMNGHNNLSRNNQDITSKLFDAVADNNQFVKIIQDTVKRSDQK